MGVRRNSRYANGGDPNVLHTPHDHVEDKTEWELRESAYRRGFHQAMAMVREAMEEGLLGPDELDVWLRSVEDWRYRLGRYEAPREELEQPPFLEDVLQDKCPPPGQLLSEALEDRNNCRVGLKGVMVRCDGIDERIVDTVWDRHSRLVVILESREAVHPEECRLVSDWPVVCCPPRKAGGGR